MVCGQERRSARHRLSRYAFVILLSMMGYSSIAHAQATNCTTANAQVTKALKRPHDLIEAKPAEAGQQQKGAAVSASPVFPHDVALGDVLTLEVTGLADLDREKECRNSRLILFLDGRPLKDLQAYPPSDPGQGKINFTLVRTESSREVWTSLLGSPSFEPRSLSVSIGMLDGFPVPSQAKIRLHAIPMDWFLFWLGILVVMVVAFFILASKSNVLRDSWPVPEIKGVPPYSLARTQAAAWFFVVLASYLFIGVVTGDFSTSITGTVTVLIGISAGTAMGSAVIDAGKPEGRGKITDEVTVLRAALAAERAISDPLRQQLAALDPNDTANAPAIKQLQNQLQARRPQEQAVEQQLRKAVDSEGFLMDIVSDADGVSFHRFQIAAWTLVLGIVFISRVYRELAMPTFGDTLLGLMGISAGTYLGLKIPEPAPPKG